MRKIKAKKYHLKLFYVKLNDTFVVKKIAFMSQKLTIRDFTKNRENPFLKEAVDQIQQNIVKKYKNSSGSSQSAILQAINSEGELVGHTSFIKQIEVDEQQFTKIYLSQFSAFFDLKPSAIKVFGYVMNQLVPKKDEFIFDLEECMIYTGYKSHKSIHEGLADLLAAKIIARGKNDYFYFINPMIAFNGDRVTFAKTYIKKQKGKIIDPNQIDLLDAIAEAEQA
jgi:hypothetical protein